MTNPPTTVLAQAFEQARARKTRTAETTQAPAKPAAGCLLWPPSYPFEQAVETLRRAGVDALADLRSPAAIRADAAPAALKPSTLKAFLREAHGIAYVRLGALGNHPEHPPFYSRGRLQKNRLTASEPWRHGFKRLLRGIAACRVCILVDSPVPATNVACQALALARIDVHPLGEHHRLPAAA